MSTLMETGVHGMPYAGEIGCILWLVMVTWPDCTFGIGILSQFIQNPGPVHWEVKWIIIYSGSMKSLWLNFTECGKMLVEGFCDAGLCKLVGNCGICLPFRSGCNKLELEKATNNCSFDS